MVTVGIVKRGNAWGGGGHIKEKATEIYCDLKGSAKIAAHIPYIKGIIDAQLVTNEIKGGKTHGGCYKPQYKRGSRSYEPCGRRHRGQACKEKK